MKKLLHVFALSAVLTFCSTMAFAQSLQTYYVCSGTTYSFTVTADASFDHYEWKDVTATPTPIGSDNAVLSLTAPTITDGVFTTRQYTLRVYKTAESCYSDIVTYTVYVLPAPTVTLNTIAAQCAGSVASLTLTATVGSLTLPANVTASAFSWKKDDVAVTPANTTNELAFSSANTAGSTTYSVSVAYAFAGPAATNGGTKLASCVGTASQTILVNPKPATPAITFQ